VPDVESRPRDAETTRARILVAARKLFAARGFRAVTVKAVADAAGVSPNLITRYFDGKDGLFLAASRTEIAADRAAGGPVSEVGARLAAGVVHRWSAQTAEDPMLVLHRASGERPEAAEELSRFLDEQSLHRLQRYFEANGMSSREAEDRAAAIDALILGVSTRRRVLRSDLGDLAALERWLAAAVQRLATGA
jgi:AcrR family transcriptional regulator